MIYNGLGQRLYCNQHEREAFIIESRKQNIDKRLFLELLALSGSRLSEVRFLTPRRIDKSSGLVVFETLKKRKRGIYRAVPLPDQFIIELSKYCADIPIDQRIWNWGRTKAWLVVKASMKNSRINGPQASPKGLRHGFAVAALQAGIPLNLLSKWLGHASLETTSIYANAIGEEERNIAKRMWK